MKPILVFGLLLAFVAPILSATSLPLVNQPLVPASTKPGSKAFTLTVNGTGFTATSVVNWNGSPRPTSVLSTSTLQATISATDVAKAGTASITVTNGVGLVSNFVFFPVRKPLASVAMAGKQVFTNCGAVAVGDFNGDGKLDIVWVDTSVVSLNVSLGDGKGGFSPPISTSTTFYGPPSFQLIVGDFNNDGKLDVAGSVPFGKTIVFLGNGDGTFTLHSPGGGGNQPNIASADFNGDGKLDLYQVGSNLGSQWFDILQGNGDGTFVLTQIYFINGFAVFPGIPAIGDFTGSGKLDLVVPTSNATGQLYLGNGDGSFTASTVVGTVSNSVAADFNRDGKLDFLTGNCIFLGHGDGIFANSGCASAGGGLGIGNVADFNGDGFLDAALGVNAVSPALAINLGKGDGTFANSFQFPSNGNGLNAVGDFNNDGKLDIITAGGLLLLQTTANLSTANLAFGSQNVGTLSSPQTVTLTNIGAAALPLQAFTITGTNPADFTKTTTCGTSLAAGASCAISITFGPKATGARSAFVNIKYSGVGSPQAIAVSGTGIASPTASLAPSSLTYTAQLVGTTSSPQTATLTNTGTQALNLASIAATAPFHETNKCPTALSAAASCQIQLTFAPTANGTATGTLSVSDDALNSPQTVALSGSGTLVTISPIGVNFGIRKVGTSSTPASLTLTNSGTTALAITQVAYIGTNPADFSQTNTCGASVPAGGTCAIKAVFKPTAIGRRAANLAVTENVGGSPQLVPVAGTGQ